MMGSLPTPPSGVLRVAIVGGGPAGLGAAIAISKLPNVRVDIYEKATELREVGAGIRIGYNAWKVLGLLGAAEGVRGHHKITVYHRSVVLRHDNIVIECSNRVAGMESMAKSLA